MASVHFNPSTKSVNSKSQKTKLVIKVSTGLGFCSKLPIDFGTILIPVL